MSEHKARIVWARTGDDFTVETFNRTHEWRFDHHLVVPGSSAPEYRGDPDHIDPEKALVGALSSCHMLFFLAYCARKGFVVERYEDDAVGILQKGPDGRTWITDVTLRPRIAFAEGKAPGPDDLKGLHDRAHHACFIANSVKTEVRVEPQ